MYPYHLGCHLRTGRLCRIPHPDFGTGIPVGFVRIIRYKDNHVWSHRWINPYSIYDGPNKGELLSWYWSIVRWTDIQRELNEKLSGPNMLRLFLQK